jgi:hypothetical protein
MNQTSKISPILRQDIKNTLKSIILRLALFNNDPISILDEIQLEAGWEICKEVRESLHIANRDSKELNPNRLQ